VITLLEWGPPAALIFLAVCGMVISQGRDNRRHHRIYLVSNEPGCGHHYCDTRLPRMRTGLPRLGEEDLDG
jgi:hypothetical protein